jgi:hypothetical protein
LPRDEAHPLASRCLSIQELKLPLSDDSAADVGPLFFNPSVRAEITTAKAETDRPARKARLIERPFHHLPKEPK